MLNNDCILKLKGSQELARNIIAFAIFSLNRVHSMKTLLILRHAKSSWDNTELSDFERPLNSRGIETAPVMGNLIYKKRLKPNLIISSPAKRAKQTAVLIKEIAQILPPIKYEEKIYEASPMGLLNIVGEIDNKNETVLLIGHNPGLEGFIKILTGENKSMPTAGLAVIELDINSWDEIKNDCGKLNALIRPRDEIRILEISEKYSKNF